MPEPKTSRLTPKYRYNEAAQRYVDKTGKFVPQTKIVNALEYQRDKARANIGNLAAQLRAGEINLAEWRAGMLKEIKVAHVASAAAAKGGWAQMTQADYGRAGGKLARQYEYLNNFAAEIQSGKAKLDGSLDVRANMYVNASRNTYERTINETKKDTGLREMRNRLGAADHCSTSAYAPGCLEMNALGWVSIDDARFVMPGERTCLTSCHCSVTYR